MVATPAQYLKEVRQRLQLGARDVQDVSAAIATEERNDSFYVSVARLTQIENGQSHPSVFKLFSLCAIYGLDLHDVLRMYGVPTSSRSFYGNSSIASKGTRIPVETQASAPHVPSRRKVGRPPGSALRVLAEFFLSKKTYEEIAKPTLADLQFEYCEALREKRRLKAKWIRLRGTCSFWLALGTSTLIKTIAGVWRRVHSI